MIYFRITVKNFLEKYITFTSVFTLLHVDGSSLGDWPMFLSEAETVVVRVCLGQRS